MEGKMGNWGRRTGGGGGGMNAAMDREDAPPREWYPVSYRPPKFGWSRRGRTLGIWRETSAACWSCQGRGRVGTGRHDWAAAAWPTKGRVRGGIFTADGSTCAVQCSAVCSQYAYVCVACTNGHGVCMYAAPWNGPCGMLARPQLGSATPPSSRVVSKGGQSPLVPRAEISPASPSEIESRPRPRLKRRRRDLPPARPNTRHPQ